MIKGNEEVSDQAPYASIKMPRIKFSSFPFRTKFSDDVFRQMEKAGNIKLNADRRAEIQGHLQRYEYFRELERMGDGIDLKHAIKRLEATVGEAISLAEGIEHPLGPKLEAGHLWSHITRRAGVNSDNELQRLRRIRTAAAELNKEIESARKHRGPNHWLSELLFKLEADFKAAGGGSTSISREEATKRGGPFLRFCAAALKALPVGIAPKKPPVGLWERLCRDRTLGKKSNVRNWVGKPHPLSTKT